MMCAKKNDAHALGRAPYSLCEAYGIVEHAMRALPGFKRAKVEGVLSDTFKERIMLAVTEVNGCALCSYAHSRMALESGMDSEEIASLLAGCMDEAPPEELPALLFAQHYAESRGKPSLASWKRVEDEYGEQKAQAILGAVCVIMAGNTYGMPFGSLKSRVTGHRDKVEARSSLGYELAMLFSLIGYVSVAFVHSLINRVLQRSLLL